MADKIVSFPSPPASPRDVLAQILSSPADSHGIRINGDRNLQVLGTLPGSLSIDGSDNIQIAFPATELQSSLDKMTCLLETLVAHQKNDH
ncbi:hypothetical protein FMZ60_08595 [Alcaligenaceae bacterium SJ-26]|nr:hypothetical protein FMZ60_08595 [Alcaligenaceae bacterium SJ-26]